MILLISNRITDILIKNDIIFSKDKELYVFGIEQGSIMLLNIITTIIVGFALGMAWQGIVVLIVYIQLRIYAGGFHAKTQLKCYLFSIGLTSAALLGIKMVPWTGFICLMVTIVASGIIFLLAPIEDSNKPLDQMELGIYKRRTRFILGSLLIMALLLWLLGQQQISICIIMAVSLLAIMLLLGELKNITINKLCHE